MIPTPETKNFDDIEIHMGDVFCTENPFFMGRAICAMERFWDLDKKAEFSHSFFTISDKTGREVLWTKRDRDFREHYRGSKILIGRHKDMTPLKASKGIMALEKFMPEYYSKWHFLKRHYPWWRIVLHIIPPLAKYISTGNYMVCSEYTKRFIDETGVNGGYGYNFWKGANPGTIENMIYNWKRWEVVFYGWAE
jgi:hypothetical protein